VSTVVCVNMLELISFTHTCSLFLFFSLSLNEPPIFVGTFTHTQSACFCLNRVVSSKKKESLAKSVDERDIRVSIFTHSPHSARFCLNSVVSSEKDRKREREKERKRKQVCVREIFS